MLAWNEFEQDSICMKKQQLYILIGIGIILIGGVVLVWQKRANQELPQKQSQKQEQNEQQNKEQQAVDIGDWKIYQDKKYGFEVKYPKDWEIKEEGANAFGGEWLVIVVKDNYKVNMQVNRRVLTDGDPLRWIKDNAVDNSIGGGQKLEVEEFLQGNPNVYAFHIKLDNKYMYVRHKYLISNKSSMVYFSFEEISRKKDRMSGEIIEEVSFSQYLPAFEAMVRSIKFVD